MKDRTSERFGCEGGGISCPAVIDKGATLVIIGNWVTVADHPELLGRIGPDEVAIEIDAELVTEALRRRNLTEVA